MATQLYSQRIGAPLTLPIMSGPTPYTPPTNVLTNATATGQYYQEGAALIGEVTVVFSGTPTFSGVDFRIGLPPGLVVDAAKITLATDRGSVGVGELFTPNGYLIANVEYDTNQSTTLPFRILAIAPLAAANNSMLNVTATSHGALAAGSSCTVRFRVPIVGWVGTTAVNGGSSGGGLAPTTITSATVAVKGKYYLANTSAGAFNVTLPAGSTDAYIRFADANDTWDSNPLTIAPSTGEQINGFSANDTLICNVKGGWVDLAWSGSRWVLSSSNASIVQAATSTSYGTVTGGTLPAAVTAPASGYHGEYRESMGTIGPISATTYSVVGNAGLPLTPGVYDIHATAQITPAATTTLLNMALLISTTNTADNTGQDPQRNMFTSYHGNITNSNGDSWRIATPLWRVIVTTTTTFYPKVYIGFGTSTCQAVTNIFARRV